MTDTISAKPTHTLIVTRDPDHPSDDPAEHRYRIECDGVTDWCRAYQECPEKDCDQDALEEAEADGDDEPVAHGVAHRSIGNTGWSVVVPGCVLPLYDSWVEEAREMKLAPGTYRFTHQYEDGGEWYSIELAESEAAR